MLFRSESPAPPDGLEDATVFVVEIPVAALASYEISTAERERRWVLPAELVNRHSPRALVAEWSE